MNLPAVLELEHFTITSKLSWSVLLQKPERNGVDISMEYPKQLSENELYWYNLIQECRTSGMSDAQWLKENNIKSPTFYYHVKKLRNKACEIPENPCTMRQPEVHEVVPVYLNDITAASTPANNQNDIHKKYCTDTAIRLQIHGIFVEITNTATQDTIQNTLAALQGLC